MDNATKFLKARKAARERLLAARKVFIAARTACTAAMKEYAKYVIPRPKKALKAGGKKGCRA